MGRLVRERWPVAAFVAAFLAALAVVGIHTPERWRLRAMFGTCVAAAALAWLPPPDGR